MGDILDFFVGTLNTIAWEYILLPCVLVGGVLFTRMNRGIQFFRFGHILRQTAGRLLVKKSADDGALTPMQALSTALAATVGTGNIVGTSQAIAMGGYGAVFWMWVAALLGMIIKYAEVVLAVRFRRRDSKGEWVGGPMYYITDGMGRRWRWLAVLFCIFATLASFGIGNMSQANAVASAFRGALQAFAPRAQIDTGHLNLGVGLALALIAAVVLLGGAKRIGRVTERLIPAMSGIYILLALAVLVGNWRNITDAFALILIGAFRPRAILGAASGIALRQTLTWGLRRCAFSNEAGLGSAAIAHAAADTPGPVQQGFFGILEVFVDTIVICTLTALTVIVSGVEIPFGSMPGTELVAAAFSTVFGARPAAVFLAVSMMLFAFSTILGWSLYGTRCVQFLLGERAVRVYQALFVCAIVLGATASVDQIWKIADTCNGLMAIPNFIALFTLSGVAGRLTRGYFSGAGGTERLNPNCHAR